MRKVNRSSDNATGGHRILFECNNNLLIYLRDDKPEISFPNHWDLFGGQVEENETPEQALIRELKEELNIDVVDYHFSKTFESTNETKANTISISELRKKFKTKKHIAEFLMQNVSIQI